MKADQFKQVIRQLIKEELHKILPDLIPQILSEALSGNKTVKIEKDNSKEEFFKSLTEDKKVNIETSPKVFKKYSNNPIYNNVLNNTVGGVPQDPINMDFIPQLPEKAPFNINAKKQENVSVPVIVDETTKRQAQANIFKDYSKLMNVIKNKKKEGSINSNVVGALNNIDRSPSQDYSTID